MHDVEPRAYATVIREMIRHENDVTNHRLMWLLIVQGLFANAYVAVSKGNGDAVVILAPVGILVTLSAFIILYKSYHARGYLQFLGGEAKQGTLREEHLPLAGWPKQRIRGWRKKVWVCPWLGQIRDLLEPYMFLPALLLVSWLFVLMRFLHMVDVWFALALAALFSAILLGVLCLLWVREEQKDETEA
jgi:hypothetical protein